MRCSNLVGLAAGLVWLGASFPLHATNGMNMIAPNTRSAGIGGAGVALDGDCPGCNPATIGGWDARTFSAGIAFVHPPVRFENTLYGPNDVDSDEKIYFVPYFDYAQRLGDESRWSAGFMFRAQGGMGVDYDPVLTPVGTLDELSTDLRLARAIPSLSYRVNDQLTLGGSLMLGYASLDSKLYPGTYGPGFDGVPGTQDDLVGMRIEDASGFGIAGRFGVHYRVNDRLSLGFSYTSETSLDLDDGRLTLNLGAASVDYDAKVDDFAWPQEAVGGFAFKATPELTLVGDVRWIGWSSAMDVITVRGGAPGLPVPVRDPEISFPMKWDDQWVFAAGAEYEFKPGHTLRFGYNYGESPVPDDYVVPLFPAHVEHHLTVGYGWNFDDGRVDLAWEHSFENDQKNTNPNPAENPFGPDSVVTANPGNVLHLAVTYRF